MQYCLLCEFPASVALSVAAGDRSGVHVQHVLCAGTVAAVLSLWTVKGKESRCRSGRIYLSATRGMIDGGPCVIKTPL